MSSAKDGVHTAITYEGEAQQALSSKAEKKLVRRLDFRLVPIVALLFLWSFLDRIAISNALTLGFQKDLGLQGTQINTALALFYVPYILFEIPSNYLLKKIGPRPWIGSLAVLIGVVQLCHGFVHNFRGLVVIRLALGLVESGLTPGCIYLLSMWYRPSEVLIRYTLFINSSQLAGAFGSLLASGLYAMDGVGILTYFFLLDLPENSTWLSPEENEFMCARVADRETAAAVRHVTLRDFFRGLAIYISDYRSYVMSILFFSIQLNGNCIAYFLPTIIQTFNYTRIQTQLHSVSPFAVSFVVSVIVSLGCQRLRNARWRLTVAACSFLVSLVGIAILLGARDNISAKYAAIHIAQAGISSGMPIVMMYYFMQLERNWSRAIGTAFVTGFGNVGSMAATFMFQAEDAANGYHRPYAVMVSAVCVSVLGTVLLGLGYEWEPMRLNR